MIPVECIYFCNTVRQRVLSQKIHELDLAEKGTLKLEVSLYETTDPAKDNAPKKEIITDTVTFTS